MISHKTTFSFLVALLIPFFCFSQDSLLLKTFEENSYQLEIKNQELSGSSLPIILKAIKESQFLMIGEQHGIKEVAEFATALSKKSFEEGFEFLCVETDPYVAEKLESLATIDMDYINSFVQQFPFAVPFYDTKEEFELIRKFTSATNNADENIWGIDQMYMGSPRFAFNILSEEAKNDKSQSLIAEYVEAAKSQFNSFLKSNNPLQLPMMQLKDSDFERLAKQFNTNSDTKVTQLITDLQTSQEIYQHVFSGENYWNNYKRSKLMKRQFMDYYNRTTAQDKIPKVILKFGAVHTSKGLSPVHLYDLGNMVSELAEMNGSKAANFKITAVKGESLDYTGAINTFNNSKNLIPEIKKLYEENDDNKKWIFIDLKSIRSELPHAEIEKIKDFVFTYDYWIIIPQANPLTKL